MEYLLGTDPEVFVFDTKAKRFISAEGLVAGSKHSPEPVEDGALQVDGLALEFNITPASNADEFDKRIGRVIEQLKERVFEASKDYSLVFTPFAKFDKAYFATEVSAEAKVLGCDPDFNIKGDMNPNPGEKLMEVPERSAAGHVHIGWTKDRGPEDEAHFEDCRYVSAFFHKQKVFAPTTLEERKRLKYYGMNGSFRPKPYGVELRSPSNLWVVASAGRRQMYETIVQNMKKLEKGN